MPTAVHPITIETDRFLADVAAAMAMGDDWYPPMGKDLMAMLERSHWRPEDRVYTKTALPRLVTLINMVGFKGISVVETCAIIAGLHTAGCWRNCLDNVDSAYGLAASIYLIVHFLSDQEENEMEYARPAILAILNDWLGHDPWDSLPVEAEVAEHLFGDAWCAVVASSSRKGSAASYLCDMITRDRPPFAPGLCPAQVLQGGSHLPELDTAGQSG